MYMAAELTDNLMYQQWNMELYAAIQQELQVLEGKKYKCPLMASLEEVLVAKYLGVNISVRGRNMAGLK